MGTALTETGQQAPRVTEWEHLPLPPKPPRLVNFTGNGRYKVPHPVTGKTVDFARATTVADTLDDTYNLNRWKTRTAVAAVVAAMDVAFAAETGTPTLTDRQKDLVRLVERLREEIADGCGTDTNKVIDVIDNMTGGRYAAEFGDAVHAWLEAVDIGMVLTHQVPEMFQPWVVAYQRELRRHGIIAVPVYVERTVLNDRGQETVVGTIDRIYLVVATGELVLGDLKTSKADNLQYSWLSYSAQFAVYGFATYMLAIDGKSWEPMPKMIGLPHPTDAVTFAEHGGVDPRPAMCLMVHVPSDAPEKSAVIPYNLTVGAEHMIESITVRQLRSQAKHRVPGLTTPIPTPEALRETEAWLALSNISDPSQGSAVVAQYQDVWNDALTERAGVIAGLFNQQ